MKKMELPTVAALLAGAFCALLSPLASAAPATVLWFQSGPGDPVADGRTVQLLAPGNAFTVDNQSNLLTIDVAGAGESWRLALSAQGLPPLAPGAYEDARHAYSQNSASRAGIAFSGDSGHCDFALMRGRFTVLEAVFNPDNTVQKFAANFEQRCYASAPPLYGEIRINSDVPLTADEPANSTVPDAFAFAPRALLTAAALVNSDYTSVYGINAPTPISIAGGEYSINGGPFTAQPGLVFNRDRLQVRVVASPIPGGTATASVTVGGVNADFVATTYLPGQSVTGLRLYSMPGEPIVVGENREYLAPPDFVDPFGGDQSIQAGFQAGVQQVTVRMYPRFSTILTPGVYEETRGFTDGTAVLDVVSELGGCPAEDLRGRFTIMEVAFGPDNTVTNLAANFEQRCGVVSMPLYGEIRINSTVPFTALKPAGSTAPDAFSFRPRTLVAPGAIVDSGPATIYGINAPAAIAITGGEYSINGLPFTSAAGIVNNRDRIVLRATASAVPGATASAMVTVGGVSATFDVTTYQPGQNFTAVRLQSTPADLVGLGKTVQLVAPPDFMAPFVQDNVVSFGFAGPDDSITVFLSGRGTDLLVPGAYENAALPFQNATNPGLLFIYNGNACETYGRFVVQEVTYGAGGEIASLAANLESRCGEGAPPLYGEIRINSAIPFTSLVAATDTAPDAFAFFARSPVRAGTVVTSNTVSVYGVNAPAPISVTGGEYSVNGLPFMSLPGFVNNLDRVTVRTTASNTAGGASTVTLTIGGVSAGMTVTTYQPGNALSGLHFLSTPGDSIGQGAIRDFIAPSETVEALNFGDNQTSFDFIGDRGATFSFDAIGPNDSRLVPGVYEGAARIGSHGSGTGLDFYGEGRACNVLSGRIVVYEAAYFPDGSVERFAADFQQNCELIQPPLFGEIRYNSTVPFSALQSPGVGSLSITPASLSTQLTAGSQRISTLQVCATNDAALANTVMLTLGATGATVGYDAVFGWDANGNGVLELSEQIPSGTRLPAYIAAGACVPVLLKVTANPLAQVGDTAQHIVSAQHPALAMVAVSATVSSTFVSSLPRNLTVTLQPAGLGTVTSIIPPGIACPGTCTAAFQENTAVTLLATPNPGVAFAGWTGCDLQNAATCTITLGGDRTVTANFTTASNVRSDLNGDGRSDVVWYHTGVFGLIGMNANGLALDPLFIIDVRPSGDWKIAGIGDLNGDGRADVVWRNDVTGEVYGLLMNGSTVLSQGTIYTEPNLAWKIEQIADLDGDDKADLVWKNGTTGEVYVMKMNGLSFTAGQVVYAEPNLDWKIVASGDMDADGKADLLWRNQTTGDVFAMLMNGFTVASGGVIYSEPNTNWKIVGLADFNGDGKADVLWQNTATGDVFEMQMNGTAVSAGQVIYNEPITAWKIVALGDYNGDGKADILWQNTSTGQVYMMLMNAFAIGSANFVYIEPDTQWRIVGP